MHKYDISKLAVQRGKRKPGTRQLMPPIKDRQSAVKQYTRVLKEMLRDLAKIVRETVIPEYRLDRLTASPSAAVRFDHWMKTGSVQDADENTFRGVRALAELLVRTSSATVNRILQLESQVHTETFINQAKSVLGIDISSIVTDEDLTEYLKAAAVRNTSLIKSLSDDTIKRIEQAVIVNQLAGNTAAQLQAQLVKDFGVMASRAELIATDQTAKLTSDLNRIRQEQAGVDKYQWMTAHDERVRPRHRQIDGNEYKWGEQTGAEDGLPPGQPIRCRCVARGIVEF